MRPLTYEHGSWYTIGAVSIGYLLLLTIIFVALFILPYLLFTAL